MTSENAAAIQVIVSKFFSKSEELPKWSVEGELYTKISGADGSVSTQTAYWPSRRQTSFWNRAVPAIDIPNTAR